MGKFHLMGEIKTLANLFKRRFDTDESLSADRKITGTHGYIIGYVYKKNQGGQEVFQRDIEKDFSLRRSSVTELVISMEKKGLLVREPVPFDKRLKKIVLTKKGIELHERVVARLDALDSELISLLSEREFTAFKSAIAKIKDKLGEQQC